MKIWQKLKSIATIPIPGSTVVISLMGVLLGTTLGLYIASRIPKIPENTLGESTFGKNESLEIDLILQNGEELHLKATGVVTTDLALSLRMILQNMVETPSKEKSYRYMPL